MAKKRKTPAKSQLITKTTSAPMIVKAATTESATVAPPAMAAVPPPTIVAVAPAARPLTVDRNAIARLAFSKFVARGGVHGHALADWLEAEAELRVGN
jgi:hypothetical protein